MPLDEELKKDAVESPKESRADSTEAEVARDSQTKSDTQKDSESQQGESRKLYNTASSTDLPRVDLFTDEGKGFAKIPDKIVDVATRNSEQTQVADSIGQGTYDTLGKKPTLLDDPRTDNPAGATVTKETTDGFVTETVTKNGETLRNEFDDAGTLQTKVYDLADGRKVRVEYTDGKPGLPSIDEPDGKNTFLHKDPKTGALVGERQDSHGKVLETVTYVDGKLIYEDVKTHAKRGESFEPPAGDHVTYQTSDLGKYDANTGTLTKEVGDVKVVTSIADGRADIQTPSGIDAGFARNGEISFQNEKTGEAAIIRPDGTGVYLKGDGTLDRWGPDPSDNAKGEKLTPGEEAYLKKHPQTDLRDFAEIHRHFKGDAAKLDDFYKSLEKIDTAKNLTAAEKAAVTKDIIDHVANPAEIYQGVTDSCNVTVIQRDLAITNPAKYAATVAEAVSEGTFTAADGTKTKLDVTNLKMADSSGRDLASRIFQGAALQAEFSPTRKYENTPDGVGRLKATSDSPAGTPREVPFDGLFPTELADIRNKLTGEEKAITFIKSEADLKKALELNGGPPMTILVDGTHAPFGEGDDSPTAPNHVVTITGIEAGPPVKYLVQNQFGLEHDHSTKATAIPADELLKNMSRYKQAGSTTVTDTNGAIVITKGDHDKAYTIIDGTRTQSTQITSNLAQSHRNPPKVATHR